MPDGCEAAGAGSYVHELDDGTHENTIGLTQGGYCAWLNHFVIADTNVRIDSIRLAYGTVPNGTPVTVYLWSDPDQDGDPHDARVLASASAVVANADRDVFNPVSIPPTYVGSAGRHFFVGAIVHHGPGQLPASLDQSTSAGQSWLAGGAESLDPNGLGKAPVALKLVDNYAFGGNWLIRAEAVGGDCNHNGIPDECDIASGSSHDQNGNGVPDECEPRPGDLNCDGRVDFGDINPFVLALIGQTQYESTFPACRWLNADCNSDELVNFGDINPFVACLTAGGCR